MFATAYKTSGYLSNTSLVTFLNIREDLVLKMDISGTGWFNRFVFLTDFNLRACRQIVFRGEV